MKTLRLITILLIISCSTDSKDKSIGEVLTASEFANILKALHLAEAKHILQKSNSIKTDSSHLIESKYDSIFHAHSIQENIFNQSMDYYLDHPKELESIYDSILIDLRDKKFNLR